MIKCLECGFEAPRLQWTHFKYNCTGRFSNGKEYKLVYPGAILVSEEVAKKTAITLENLIKKYGEVAGTEKWNQYREKQAKSNSFEYKQEKFNWTKDQFDEYNSSRAQTLEKMMMRYGEIEGAAKWENYCLRQAYTNTKEYFVEKYGEEVGVEKYLSVNKKKAITTNPLALSNHLNISVEDATGIIVSRQKSFFSNIEKEFIELIEKKIGKLQHTSLHKPFGLWSTYLNTYVVYDIKHNDYVIEFNGDYWHANPLLYKETDMLRGKSAACVWEKDMLKLKTAQDRNLKTLVIWESEFKVNKEATIEKVIKCISNELP
ncbi:hypothetical protein UFOVP116_325 [uncultured Caudovirales phage]|uniref:Uncharacterized protein n=1 Tax=uncultured Caudovirales phage TaxID=2100421 RepID=A0A6J5L732_9CAUD|nr:hypothetical protein UFOVP116_325 [uncultured Caudovirales phage]